MTRARDPRRWLLAGLLASAPACVADPTVEWTIELRDASALGRVHAIRATIRTGDCDGAERAVFDGWYDRGTRPAIQSLSPGRHAFHAYAVDAACMRIAAGCTSGDVTGSGDLRVTTFLDPLATPVADADCTRSDGGVADGAAAEASSPDAGAADTGVDAASMDASVRECDGTTGCSCPPGSTCSIRCTTSPCEVDCGAGSTCTVMCPDMPCRVDCPSSAVCELQCGMPDPVCSSGSGHGNLTMLCTEAGSCCPEGSPGCEPDAG